MIQNDSNQLQLPAKAFQAKNSRKAFHSKTRQSSKKFQRIRRALLDLEGKQGALCIRNLIRLGRLKIKFIKLNAIICKSNYDSFNLKFSFLRSVRQSLSFPARVALLAGQMKFVL